MGSIILVLSITTNQSKLPKPVIKSSHEAVIVIIIIIIVIIIITNIVIINIGISHLHSYLYLHLKNIFIKKKLSTFANLLMEKSGDWFGIAKMSEKYLKQKKVLGKGLYFYSKLSSGTVSASACTNQPPGVSVSGTLTPNWLSQTINELKRLMVTPNGSIKYNMVYFSI